MASSENPSIRT